jgi:hypothetical protein
VGAFEKCVEGAKDNSAMMTTDHTQLKRRRS